MKTEVSGKQKMNEEDEKQFVETKMRSKLHTAKMGTSVISVCISGHRMIREEFCMPYNNNYTWNNKHCSMAEISTMKKDFYK